MELSFGKNELIADEVHHKTFPKQEWLLTNGIGGFASSTIIGLNTRRYHGLLVASLNPPVDRRLLVAKLDEDLYIDDQLYVLGTNQVRDGYAQRGYVYLQRFERYPFPTYTYQMEGVFLIKTILMVHGENTTVVHYKVINPFQKEISLYIFPLLNCRDFHYITRENQWPFQQELIEGKQLKVEPYKESPHIYMVFDQLSYKSDPSWYRGMYYLIEDYRGLPCYEDHHIPGYFYKNFNKSEEFSIVVSTEEVKDFDYDACMKREKERQQQLLEQAGCRDDFIQKLVLAADDFIVYRASTGRKSIIAGYPWFNDWGRDAMIALPGLTLCTRRFQDARDILATFAEHTKEGLVPNMFTDGEEPLYNTVDASLWFIYAVQKYLAYTKDYAFVKNHLWKTMQEIICCYRDGTRYGIGMEQDGLIRAGSSGLQLTWMDAKVGDWVVTPRQGKPVEVNALWYNALMLMSELAVAMNNRDDYGELAAIAGRSFVDLFWYEEGGYLYDVIEESNKDPHLRPNQIIAVSLPYSPLPFPKARSVVMRTFEKLYAVYGLRSLSPDDQDFRGDYGGDQYRRDGAYHQGTVWSWLLGHFVTACMKVLDSQERSTIAHLLIAPFKDHLRQHGIGTVSEIFEGDHPFIPRGAFAQAWGVGELLRCCAEDLRSEKLYSL
ncbi:MAG: amylo-alpha-1,6-glucosidase [Thermacetogeniaceae bacterium]